VFGRLERFCLALTCSRAPMAHVAPVCAAQQLVAFAALPRRRSPCRPYPRGPGAPPPARASSSALADMAQGTWARGRYPLGLAIAASPLPRAGASLRRALACETTEETQASTVLKCPGSGPPAQRQRQAAPLRAAGRCAVCARGLALGGPRETRRRSARPWRWCQASPSLRSIRRSLAPALPALVPGQSEAGGGGVQGFEMVPARREGGRGTTGAVAGVGDGGRRGGGVA